MKTPFEILNVQQDADDQQIKKAYLEAVRRYPPERDPQQFQRTRWAYEQIATMEDRLKYMLFDTSLPEPDEIVEALLEIRGRQKPDLGKNFRDMLGCGINACAKRLI